MHNLFEQAKVIALRSVREWLPEGRQDGDEWRAINPTRSDHEIGSFSVNLKTGQWADFADDSARGNDCVSLFYYLNQSVIDQKVFGMTYKNHRSGAMVESAKELLLRHDPTYWPDDKDVFNVPAEKSKNEWYGFNIITNGIDNDFDLEPKHKNNEKTWNFKYKNKIYMKIVRFRNADGKKSDIPFTPWTNGKETKWRAKAAEQYYFYNVDKLTERLNDPVLITEGQKDAAILDEFLPDYISLGWYGGAGSTAKTDWTCLPGREVYFSFDADIPGRKALAKIIDLSKEYSFRLHAVYPPKGVKKGWSIADAVEEGWTVEKIKSFLQSEKEEDEENKFVDDDNGMDFKILGYSGSDIVFYSYNSKRIVQHKAESLTKGVLMTLMDRSKWADYFAKTDGGIAWDAAVNYILRIAEDMDEFNPATIRTGGAWWDAGRIVLHGGNELYVDGQACALDKIEAQFVYKKAKTIPYCQEKPLSVEESGKLNDILDLLFFEHKSQKEFLAGWLLTAPYCGILRWRSHCWITGAPGSGKSHVLENIVAKLINIDFGVFGSGSSTPAGIRSKLNNSSQPVIIDEMESDSKRKEEYVDQILTLLREGSSGTDAIFSTLHGTSDGEGKVWSIQTQALCASIGSAIKHSADKSRFTLIDMMNLKTIDQTLREEKYKELQEAELILTQSWSRAFHARTASILPELIICVNVFCEQCAKILGGRREGDQLGTLLAGAWMVNHDKAATAHEAVEKIQELEIESVNKIKYEKIDEEQIIDDIMTYKVDITDGAERSKVSIGQACQYWFALNGIFNPEKIEEYSFPGGNIKSIKRELETWGIKLVKEDVYFAHRNKQIEKILQNSAWKSVYSDVLKRNKGCHTDKPLGPSGFAGQSYRYWPISYKEIFYEDCPF